MAGFLKEKRLWSADNWMALLAIAAIGLLPFLGFLTSSGQALYASDQLGAPAWKFYFDALRSGTIPMWHPYGLGGMPSFDAGFGDGAYPLFLLIGMVMPIKTFISWCFVAHVLIAGFTAYYLVNRFFRLDKAMSTALAAAYMLNTNFISHIHAGHTGKFYIMAWLPLSLYFLLRSLRKDARIRHFLGLALSISLLLSTFHPQFIYYVLMGYFLIWAFKSFWLVKDKDFPRAGLVAARFWIPVLSGIGLLFFLLYPPMQWTKHFGVRGSGEKTTYEHATSWSMNQEEAASLIVPEFGGLNEKYWGRNPFKLNSEYPGLSLWFMGILGLVLFRREKRGWFWLWGGIALLSIIFGLGAHTPLFRLFYALVPGIKSFRAPSMMLFWLSTALLVMAADALSRLSDPKAVSADRRKGWGKRLMQVGLGAAALLIVAGLAPGMVYGIWDAVFGGEALSKLANRAAGQSAFALGALRAGILVGILTFAVRKWLLDSIAPLRFGLVLLAVTCVDLLWVNANFITTYDPERFLATQPAVEFLKADTSHARVFGMPGAYERGIMQYHGIETTDGWTDNEYRLYREYRGDDYMNNPNFMAGLKQNPDGSVSGSPFLDMLNVKYLAYRLEGDGALHLAPNTSVLPRAWFVAAWDTLSDSLALEKMKAPGFNPRVLAYVSDSTALPEGFAASKEPEAGQPQGAVNAAALDSALAPTDSAGPRAAPIPSAVAAAGITRLEKGYNRIAYRVETARPGILVLSELWFPHWHLKVDGKDAPLLRTNFAFRGAALTSGTHEVAITYESPWIKNGFLAAGLSLAILSLGLFGLARFGHAASRPSGTAGGPGPADKAGIASGKD